MGSSEQLRAVAGSREWWRAVESKSCYTKSQPSRAVETNYILEGVVLEGAKDVKHSAAHALNQWSPLTIL